VRMSPWAPAKGVAGSPRDYQELREPRIRVCVTSLLPRGGRGKQAFAPFYICSFLKSERALTEMVETDRSVLNFAKGSVLLRAEHANPLLQG
jgi:hypothetical protein